MSRIKEYGKISEYLKDQQHPFYYILEDLGMLFTAFPPSGTGVTLLLPDRTGVKEIKTLFAAGNTADAITAVKSCIIPMYLKTLPDFRGDIHTNSGKNLDIVSTTSQSVKLNGGQEISQDMKFQASGNAQIAVYLLKGGIHPGLEVIKGGDDTELVTKGDRQKYVDTGGSVQIIIETAALLRAGKTMGPPVPGRGLDYLTHSGISLINFLKTTAGDKQLGNLLSVCHPVSPLYYLFALPLVNSKTIAEWTYTNQKYDKKATLMASLGAGAPGKPVHMNPDESFYRSLNSKVMCGAINAEALGKAKDIVAEYTDTIKKYFGTAQNFIAWWLLVSEFTYLHTKPYTDDMDRQKSNGTVDLIMEIFQRHVSPAIHKAITPAGIDWKAPAMLVCCELDTQLITSGERFCTIIALCVSKRFLSNHNYTRYEALKGVENAAGFVDGVDYSPDPTPNRFTPTSNEHTTIAFWERRLNTY